MVLPLLAGLAALSPSGLAAGEIPPADAVPSRAGGLDDLQLEAIVNGRPRHLIARFRQRDDGRLAAPRFELAEIGVKAPGAGDPQEEVALDDIDGLAYDYDAPRQQIRLTLAPQAMAERVYRAGTQNRDRRAEELAETPFGGLLNYHLRSSMMRDFRSAANYQGASATLDARLFSPYGVFRSAAIVGSTVANRFTQVRLDTNLSYADPERLRNYVLGDTIATGPAWARSIRLAGVQVQRNYGLRPDLVTAALPAISGSAAVPTTVDVYVNNMLTISQPVEPGPYRIDAIPVAGDGSTRVLTRDATGQVIETSTPFIVNSRILAPGAYDWSLEFGLPRQYYALRSDFYSRTAVASGSLRHSVTDWLTVEAHGEAASSLFGNASAGASFRLFDRAVASVAAGGSYWRGAVGSLFYAGFETRVLGAYVSLSSQRTFGLFNDLASVTAPTENVYGQPFLFGQSVADARLWSRSQAGFYGAYYSSLRPPRALDRASFGFPAPFDEKTTVNLTLVNIAQGPGARNSRMATLGASRTLFGDISAYVALTYDIVNRDQRSVFAGLSMPLGGGTTVSASFAPLNGRSGVMVDAGRPISQEAGSWGWRVRNTGLNGSGAYREAAVGYRHEYGRIEAGASQMDRTAGGYVEADGALAAVWGAGVAAGNHVSDSFALVNAGAPGVEVLSENRRVGDTNMLGTLLVPNLRAFESNRLALNMETVPLDRQVAESERMVRPMRGAGVAVDFAGKRRQSGLVVILTDEKGARLPAGARAMASGSGDALVVGYDGRLWLPEPQAENDVVVSLGMTECRARFPRPEPGVRTLGPVVCQ